VLCPDDRSLYTEALTPPPGYVFDQGVATTYSLDPATLLSVPIHLALLGQREEEERELVALLEALRRVAGRTTIYAQRGRMQVPRGEHLLYGLLESMVVEVAAPRGGAFHPKLWVQRFAAPATGDVLLRLLVLSRNVTADHAWDTCLRLEGVPGGRRIAANRALADLVRALPGMARETVATERREQAEGLAAEVHRTPWELPEGFQSVTFHVLGLDGRGWRVPASRRLAVVSPFVTDEALAAMGETTDEPVALVSRPESLALLEDDPGACFGQVYALDEAAESEDGEEVASRDTVGLHAKVIVTENGAEMRLFVGSANCTTAALVAGRNVEVVAELAGSRKTAGGVEDLLGPDGLQDYLVSYRRGEQDAPEPAERAAEERLEAARRELAGTDLRLHCQAEGDQWRLVLRAPEPIPLEGVAALRAWPVTVRDERAVDAGGLWEQGRADLGTYATASVTGIIGFELGARDADMTLRFALNIPLESPPADRDAAILRIVLANREGFLRYLLLLLGEFGDSTAWLEAKGGGGRFQWLGARGEEMPLLEDMTRAFSRDPARLHAARRIVERLRESEQGAEVVPEDFLALWAVFEQALGEPEQ